MSFITPISSTSDTIATIASRIQNASRTTVTLPRGLSGRYHMTAGGGGGGGGGGCGGARPLSTWAPASTAGMLTNRSAVCAASAARESAGVEARVARDVRAVVRLAVTSGPQVEAHVRPVPLERVREVGVDRPERVVAPDVEPDAPSLEAGGRRVDVVAGEVLGVVEGPGRGVAAALPQRRRV